MLQRDVLIRLLDQVCRSYANEHVDLEFTLPLVTAVGNARIFLDSLRTKHEGGIFAAQVASYATDLWLTLSEYVSSDGSNDSRVQSALKRLKDALGRRGAP